MKDVPGLALTLRRVLQHWDLEVSEDQAPLEPPFPPGDASPQEAFDRDSIDRAVDQAFVQAAPAGVSASQEAPDPRQVTLHPVSDGLINDTFIVQSPRERWLLQRIHTVFAPEIHLNIRAVSEHLRRRGLQSPQLVPTRDHQDMVQDDEGRTWRMLEFITGTTLQRLQSPPQAEAAARSLARWHHALADCSHRFMGLRRGVHDTPRHLHNLDIALDNHKKHPLWAPVKAHRDRLRQALADCAPLPEHELAVGHGDPKINNLRWDPSGTRALAWIDLDTVGPCEVAHELGDALRSWCNPQSENEEDIEIDLELHRAAVRGYIQHSPVQSPQILRDALIWGPCWISLELASRFLADALQESYFAYDATRFASRGEHNLTRAQGQLALYFSFAQHQSTRQSHIEKALQTLAPVPS